MLTEDLIKFGLTYKEATVYLTLLELGPAVVSDIAKKTKTNRSTTYVLLEALVNKGLLSISEKNKVKVYNASAPERLIKYLEDTVQKYTELVGVAHGILPELKSMYVGTGPKPKVQFFEGLEGIKTAYEDTLTAKETIRAFASIEDMHNTLKDYFLEYYKRRAAKKIKIRAIFPDTPEAKERIKSNTEEMREALLVPSDRYAFSPEINIYNNKIVFMSLLEKFALIIESKELADSFKRIYELSWNEARRLDQEIKK